MKRNITVLSFAILLISFNVSKSDGQPADNSKFEWIRHAHIFIVDGYYYPICPSLEFNAEKMAATMADMHANVLRIATSGHCGWMIPGTKFVPSPDLGSRDVLAECIAACKPRGIKVVPYINTSHTQKTTQINPDWAQKLSPAGNFSSHWSMNQKVTPICFNSSYREAFYDLVKTVVSKYDIDGIYFDTWMPFHFFSGKEKICYCDGCRKGFREATGLEIPYRENPDDYTASERKVLDVYRDWCKEELYKVFAETRRIVKSYKDIPMIYNIGNPPTIIGEDFRILNGSDAFLYERGRSMIERAEGVSLATTHGLAVWPYVGTYDPYPRLPHYGYELGQEIYTSVAFGGSPILYHTYFFSNYPESRTIVKDAFTVLDKNDQYINGFKSGKYCAVIWNETDPPGHAADDWLWDTNARLSSLGSFSACIRKHVQVTSMLKQDLDNPELLNKFKVLFLPDICYLTDNQVKNITDFVSNGGGLVMTYSTSLYDEKGQRRQDFALGSLAGIKYRKPDSLLREIKSRRYYFGSASDIWFRTRTDQKVIKPPLSQDLIPAFHYETVEALPNGKVMADIVEGNNPQPVVPGLVVSQCGKGKVAYIAATTGAMFQQTGIMQFADFIKDVIGYVSQDSAPYEIEAPPSTLLTNMTENGNKRVFHLITWPGSQAESMWQNVYFIPEIKDVKIIFNIPAGKSVKAVTTFIPAKLEKKISGNTLILTIPSIDKYQAVVIELK